VDFDGDFSEKEQLILDLHNKKWYDFFRRKGFSFRLKEFLRDISLVL
jgi:hypothetical protein